MYVCVLTIRLSHYYILTWSPSLFVIRIIKSVINYVLINYCLFCFCPLPRGRTFSLIVAMLVRLQMFMYCSVLEYLCKTMLRVWQFFLCSIFFSSTWWLTDCLSVFSFHVHLLCNSATPPHQVSYLIFMYLPFFLFSSPSGGWLSVMGFCPGCSALVHAGGEIVALFAGEPLLLFSFI